MGEAFQSGGERDGAVHFSPTQARAWRLYMLYVFGP